VSPLDPIWQRVVRERFFPARSIHGPDHWARVERNALYLARRLGGNETVVSLFALFHDCMRKNEGRDPGHGRRGAEYARSLRKELSFLSRSEFDLLFYACDWHTEETHTEDITAACCFDADRLDLTRLGRSIHPDRLNTGPARDLVIRQRLGDLDSLPLRVIAGHGTVSP